MVALFIAQSLCMNHIFQDYQTKYLFLLVGENPLPNYVAAKLLLAEEGTVYLVYSGGNGGTHQQSLRLSKTLRDEKITVHSIAIDDEADAFRIQRQIADLAAGLSGESVGLHYSGGTKPMAIHTYRALVDYGKERSLSLIFSYLDSRQIQLRIDRPAADAICIPITPQDLSVGLKAIFSLHRGHSQSRKAFVNTPHLIDVATALTETASEKVSAKAWFSWFLSYFGSHRDKEILTTRKIFKENGDKGNWKPNTVLETLTFSTESVPPAVVEVFRTRGYLDADDRVSFSEVKKQKDFKDLQAFCKWLDGLWLEHYVLAQVAKIAQETNSIDYGMNFEIQLSEAHFEFDVAFTYGYQLFAISCTTLGDQSGQRSATKLKLLEAYIRAQQMGGTEARVALVCLADEPNSIREELSGFLSRSKVEVFGRSHLLTLDKSIAKWMKNNDAELSK